MKQSYEAKRAMLRMLDKELDGLTGRFLSQAEQDRLKTISNEMERLEYELDRLDEIRD